MHRPVMVHRALMGSLERFFGILEEHYAGQFPLWLAPATLVPVTEKHREYAHEVEGELRKQGLRVHVDDRNEKLGQPHPRGPGAEGAVHVRGGRQGGRVADGVGAGTGTATSGPR
ncbi:MAG: His/Gly/Thr/Pro-type tRNA ligase C-terminal domain-containing protein [Vicinamibacteria bacterium]